MQEPGNNNAGTVLKILSIRLSPDGLSFTEGTESDGFRTGQYTFEKGDGLLPGLEAYLSGEQFPQGPYDRVCLFPETDRTVLLPEALWREDMAEDYLRTNSLEMRPDERILISAPLKGTRAVILSPREITEMLERKFPGLLSLSPLQTTYAAGEKHTMTLLLSTSLVHLSWFGEKPEYAETLCYGTPADMLYYLNRLSADFDLSRATLRIAGHKDDTLTRLLKRYYKNVETANLARMLYFAVKSI